MERKSVVFSELPRTLRLLARLRARRSRGLQLVVKRALDLGAGLGLTLLGGAAVAACAGLVRLFLGPGPVFFRQVRLGRNGNAFHVVKLRTLAERYDDRGLPLPEGQRLGRVGWLIRRFSLDELPQVVNVLNGDMSLIGPRPMLPEMAIVYHLEDWRRHDMRPGISGLAQVVGRHTLTFGQRLELDRWYVDNWSLWLDLWIASRTPAAVFGRRHVRRPDQPAQEVDDLRFNEFLAKVREQAVRIRQQRDSQRQP